MHWQLNTQVCDTYSVWGNSVIVLHPFSGETLHLTGVAKEVFWLLSLKNCDNGDLLSVISTQQDDAENTSQALNDQILGIVNELAKKEIIIQCR